ncbi:phage tail protein [Mahella australiensis]|uniref:Phage minor structural protein n=1 Tax=Mahella australiensis (strain DSM 15567 / CIP 107919 / 50-1 BON) TaxID=697281 RepID=F3ZVD1_MAHA5|nr:phage tail protein [Mahella australiensis]AEE95281.1 phage minor structural protein [Mahella australiensis 50-1 BON]
MRNYPIVVDNNGNPVAVLDKAFDAKMTDQLITDTNGQETIEFSLPMDDRKRGYLDNEVHIRCMGREFSVRVLEDTRSQDGQLTTKVTAEATWYDLADPEPVSNLSMTNVGARPVIDKILKNTNWTVGTVEISIPRNFAIGDPVSPLEALRQVPLVYGGELQFDSINKKVNLLEQVGEERGILFAYKKNISEVRRIMDTRDIVTRIYPYGASGLTIASVNNGKEYIEDYSWFDTVGKPRLLKAATVQDERFTNPSHLKQWAEDKLAKASWPTISYEVSVALLDDIPDLGDIVIVYDEELGLNQRMRVAQRSIDVLEPFNSTVQLDTALKTLADQMVDTGGGGTSVAAVTDAVQQAMEDVVMFNLLFNSRADDGFNYWINQGWTVDNTAGVSGKAAFVATGQMGVEKSLSQTVSVANREAYTISAQVELDNISMGPSGRIGFEIIIEYEDGTTETQFIEVG